MSTTFQENVQAAQQTLERIKEAAPRLSPAARRELLRRLKDINAGQARAQAHAAVDEYVKRGRNGNMEDVEQAISNTIDVPERTDRQGTGGERRSGVWWHGAELEPDE